MALGCRPVRGMIVWLEEEFIERVLPVMEDASKNRRPYLVVQSDLLNDACPHTLIVPLSTVPPSGRAPMEAKISAQCCPNKVDSWAQCSQVMSVQNGDIREKPYEKTVPLRVMQDVDRSLRRALDLDPDHYYNPPED